MSLETKNHSPTKCCPYKPASKCWHRQAESKRKKRKLLKLHSVFSSSKGVKAESNNRKTIAKYSDARKLDNTLLSNPWVKEEISRKKYKCIGLDEEQKWNIISMGVAFKRG